MKKGAASAFLVERRMFSSGHVRQLKSRSGVFADFTWQSSDVWLSCSGARIDYDPEKSREILGDWRGGRR